MNELLIISFVFALAVGWIFLLIRHYYLIRFTFQKYMSEKYPDKWKALKTENNLTAKWLRTEKWFHPYISQSVYNFIWRSKDNLNDPIVEVLKKRIRWSGWHIPLYFLFVICCVILIPVLNQIK